jgi:hypothetical protein
MSVLDLKYKNKYLKYKNKYLNFQRQIGGVNDEVEAPLPRRQNAVTGQERVPPNEVALFDALLEQMLARREVLRQQAPRREVLRQQAPRQVLATLLPTQNEEQAKQELVREQNRLEVLLKQEVVEALQQTLARLKGNSQQTLPRLEAPSPLNVEQARMAGLSLDEELVCYTQAQLDALPPLNEEQARRERERCRQIREDAAKRALEQEQARRNAPPRPSPDPDDDLYD